MVVWVAWVVSGSLGDLKWVVSVVTGMVILIAAMDADTVVMDMVMDMVVMDTVMDTVVTLVTVVVMVFHMEAHPMLVRKLALLDLDDKELEF